MTNVTENLLEGLRKGLSFLESKKVKSETDEKNILLYKDSIKTIDQNQKTIKSCQK